MSSFPILVDEWQDLPKGFSPDEDLFVCTDLHGCSEAMERLLSKKPADTRLVFLGDAIDRGPDPIGVLKRLLAEPDIIILRGNHDAMAWFSYPENPGSPESRRHWRNNSGDRTKRAFAKALEAGESPGQHCPSVPAVFENYWTSAKNWWRSGNFLFVHAGIPADAPEGWLDMDPVYAVCHEDSPYWWRPWSETERYQKPVYLNGEALFVVTGHTPCEEKYTICPFGMMLDKGYSLKLAAEIRAGSASQRAKVRIIKTKCDEVR